MELPNLKNLSRDEMIMYGLVALNLVLIIIILFKYRNEENYEVSSEKQTEMRNKQAAAASFVQSILKKNEIPFTEEPILFDDHDNHDNYIKNKQKKEVSFKPY